MNIGLVAVVGLAWLQTTCRGVRWGINTISRLGIMPDRNLGKANLKDAGVQAFYFLLRNLLVTNDMTPAATYRMKVMLTSCCARSPHCWWKHHSVRKYFNPGDTNLFDHFLSPYIFRGFENDWCETDANRDSSCIEPWYLVVSHRSNVYLSTDLK